MNQIIVTIKGKEIQRYPLTQQSVKIGRGAGNDISLPNETVSRDHALINYVNQGFWIQPLNNDNTIWINGQPCQQPTALANQDRVQIGKYVLTLMIAETQALSSPLFNSFERTEALSIDDLHKYAAAYDAQQSKSHMEVRLEKVQTLEKQLKLYRILLAISILAHLYTLYYFK